MTFCSNYNCDLWLDQINRIAVPQKEKEKKIKIFNRIAGTMVYGVHLRINIFFSEYASLLAIPRCQK